MARPGHSISFYNDFREEYYSDSPDAPYGVAAHPKDGIHLDFYRVGGRNSYYPGDYWAVLNDSRFAEAVDAIDELGKIMNPAGQTMTQWFMSQPTTQLDWRYSDPAFSVGRFLRYTADYSNASHSTWNPQSLSDPVAWLQVMGYWPGSGGSKGSPEPPGGGPSITEVAGGDGSVFTSPASLPISLPNAVGWIQANPIKALAIGVAAYVLLGKKGL